MTHRHPRTILLVEDSLADAELVVDALREVHLAHTLIHVEDGVDCMDYLQCRGEWARREPINPVVVLLDIKMPRMDGLEVLTRMRSDDRLRRVPVVILSSSREESDLARGWDLGVNAYVIKSVDVSQFLESVRTSAQFWAVLNQGPEEE
ncbi:response regulator [Dyella tabacisoli]|uniref:Response regulator n=1 Tax=Dyella tabacisoli TaxID=2282381 RepID=A0A369UJ36_9GAMM|nr:response regulator [Dyella tabacisoli]RDD80527.1 response regulator [Dyella tabacisoli]